MLIQPYQLEELKFAWCNRIYFRTRTHRRKPVGSLAKLKTTELAELLKPYDIHLLDFTSSEHELRGLLSLTANEATSTAISKTKGRISKWLSEQTRDSAPHKHLAPGYFAVTAGQSNAAAVEQYLENQPEHHGYSERARPPVLVRSISHPDEVVRKLQTDHAVTRLRYHLVFVVPKRRGVFYDEAADAVTNRWLELEGLFPIEKVSFLPDHVHIATSLHPQISPSVVTCELMTSSQEVMWQRFPSSVVNAGIERLWQASAYVGSFGDLSSKAVSAYTRRWAESVD